MKYLVPIFVVLHLFAQTSYGKNVNYLHLVFVNNLIHPTGHEIETLTNLVAYPFIRATESSFKKEHFDLVVNYTMIFSTKPDRIITLQSSDTENYTMEYFQHLVQMHATKNCKGSTLENLRRALEIASKPSIILTAVNRAPKDTNLLIEILETMIAKVTPVVVFQIEEEGSISDLPIEKEKKSKLILDLLAGLNPDKDEEDLTRKSKRLARNMEANANPNAPAIFQKNNDTLPREFRSIMQVTRDIFYLMAFENMKLEMNSILNSDALRPASKFSYSFSRSFDERKVAFQYEVVNATEKDFEDFLELEKSFYPIRNASKVFATRKRDDGFCDQDGPIWAYASGSNPVFVMEKSIDYTMNDFQTTIKTQIQEGFDQAWLKSLKNVVQIIPAVSWSSYYDKKTFSDYKLPKFVQLVDQMKTRILFYGYATSSDLEKVWQKAHYDAVWQKASEQLRLKQQE